jgi:hypothetical protein
MEPYCDYPLRNKDYIINGHRISFRDYVAAITTKRRKPKTVKKNKKRR